MSDAQPAHKRILLKLSGEALMGDDAFGINRATIVRMVEEVAEVAEARVVAHADDLALAALQLADQAPAGRRGAEVAGLDVGDDVVRLAELGGVSGVGPAKLERYGQDVLAAVAAGAEAPAA